MATNYEFGEEISISWGDIYTSNISNNACLANVPRYAYGGGVCEATLLEMHNFSHTDEGYKFPEWMSGGNERKMKPYAGKVTPSVTISYNAAILRYYECPILHNTSWFSITKLAWINAFIYNSSLQGRRTDLFNG